MNIFLFTVQRQNIYQYCANLRLINEEVNDDFEDDERKNNCGPVRFLNKILSLYT